MRMNMLTDAHRLMYQIVSMDLLNLFPVSVMVKFDLIILRSGKVVFLRRVRPWRL